MAESKPTLIVPLNGSNYPTWKLQCRMALVREGLWGIVSGTETAPAEGGDRRMKFLSRRDRALATIVLAVDPSLLYLIGDPVDPVEVWGKLQNQFQKKTWANKLALRRRLHTLQLRDGESVQDHVKAMTELFNELAIVGDAIEEEDRVVYLLASLPDSFNTLVTALEANEGVPKMEVVTERLLHTERKQKEQLCSDTIGEKALTTRRQFKGRCNYCKRYGHMQKNCTERIKDEGKSKPGGSSDTERGKKKGSKVGLLTCHVLGVRKHSETWIVDSGATCHICNSKELFDDYQPLPKPQKVTLGDNHTIEAIGKGRVEVKLKLPDGGSKIGRLSDVLYVPTLAYNLLSVAKVTEAGKTAHFGETQGEFVDSHGEVVAVASKVGCLYYLDCESIPNQQINSASHQSKESMWHRRLGHLGQRSLCSMKKDRLVDGFDYDMSKEIDFCESCVSGKICRSSFPKCGRDRATEPLGIVHSDVCGKLSSPSLSKAEYFVVFIDDKTHYVWIYVLQHKHEVFHKFVKWKSFVEKLSGYQVKKLRTDNGGEYTSTEFENFLMMEGIEHQYTIPKTPEQNGVSERMNRTLVETIRSMLADSRLSHKFWAEALSTAAYLINRRPTKSLDGKTPFEAWYGKKPNVSHLRVFGCTAYIHVPKDERKKLDPKAKKCIFLGYGTTRKVYRLYNQKTSSIVHSRDVVFNELARGHECEQGKHLICVENFSDEKSEESQAQAEDSEDNSESEGEDDVRESVEDLTEPPAPRRSTRETRRPDYYSAQVYTATELQEPQTVKEALSCPENEEWKAAMQKEMESISSNGVWDLVELPKDRKPVGNKWVFKKKTNADGSIERYKARLVAQGFPQKQGLDYDETFSPVIRFESFRSLVAIAVKNGLKLHQLDITAAFLNGHLEEEVFMRQPEGFVEKGKQHLVCRLKQSLYGLKQSPRCWNSTLDAHLKDMGYVQSTNDPCIYTTTNGELSIIGVYVDDFVIAGKSSERIEQVKAAISQKFDVKDLGELHYFLGVQVVQNHTEGTVWIGQPTFTEAVLRKYGMDESKYVKTPVSVNCKLLKASEECEVVDQGLYQSAVGSLLYLATRTRPDIAFAVNNVARFCSKPTKEHWMAVKRVFRYLRGTTQLGLLYTKEVESNVLIGYSDADWGGDCNDYKSTSGYLFMIGGTVVTWKSKKQSAVALSTAEAEYMALSSAAQEAVWLRELTSDLGNPQCQPTLIMEDNQSAISMAKNPQFHGRTKHINIKYHFVRKQVNDNNIRLEYCPTEDMLADILTKGIGPEKFERLRRMCSMYNHSIE